MHKKEIEREREGGGREREGEKEGGERGNIMETLFSIDAKEDGMVSLQGNIDPILSKSIRVCKQTSISVRLSSRSHEKSLPFTGIKLHHRATCHHLTYTQN